MSTRLKHVGLIMLAQIGCVATGVWVQHRYVMSTVSRAAETNTWERLDDAAAAMIAALLGGDQDTGDLVSQSLESVGERLASASLVDRYPQVLVDSEWRVLACRAATGTYGDCPPLGEVLVWQETQAELPNVSAGIAGRLKTGNGEHVALALPVENGAGHLLATRPIEAIRRRAATLTLSLSLAGFIAGAWTCALLGMTVFMIVARQQDRIESQRADADAKSLRHIQSLVRTRDAVVFGLAKLADSRDPETGDHLERIAIYSSSLASAVRSHPKYADVVTSSFVRLINISSALHDIGKVGIEDSILLKPGPLTPEERKRMQVHTVIAGECLRQIEHRLGRSNFLQMAREIALAHHERWDGTGYPNGIAGDDIPLAARIVSIADMYDALSSRRVYKDAMPHGQCVDIIREGAGTQFDPQLVEIWLKISDQYRDLAQRYSPSAIGSDGVPVSDPVTREEEMVPAAR